MFLFFLLLISLQRMCVYSFSDLFDNPGVEIDLEIKGYSNPSMVSCICATKQNCSMKCRVKFTLMYTTDDGDIKNYIRGFLDLDANGELYEQKMLTYEQSFWLHFKTKPKSLKIIANISESSTTPNETVVSNSSSHYDEFVIPFESIVPKMWKSEGIHEKKYEGIIPGSSLSLAIDMKCAGYLLGPLCDLQCIKHKNNTESALCMSVTTGDHSICKQVEDGQVDNCEKTPWTLNNSTFEMNDQEEEQQCAQEPRQSIVDDWKVIAIAIGVMVLTATLTFFLGFKMSSRLADKKKNKDTFSVSHLPLVSL